MGLLGSTLTAPILGPIRGVLWLARMIEEQVNAELYDETRFAPSSPNWSSRST